MPLRQGPDFARLLSAGQEAAEIRRERLKKQGSVRISNNRRYNRSAEAVSFGETSAVSQHFSSRE